MTDREYWDIRGRSFPGYRENDEFKTRVIETIQNHGVDLSDAHILDLGCGAGAYTLAFAKTARLVTALDISPVMIDRVKNSAQELGITNINYVESDWTEYEPEKPFDVIFCSRSPAIKDPDTLRKMCKALTRWGIVLHFAGDADASSSSYIFRGKLLDLHGIPNNHTKRDFSIIQDWLRDDGIPFTVYPLKGERRVYYSHDEIMASACDAVEAAGAKPDPRIIEDHLEQFRDDASGKYLSTTRLDMALVIWHGR